MRVRLTRPHDGGGMAPLLVDARVADLPDTDPATGLPTDVPAGAERVDPETPVSEWRPEVIRSLPPVA